MSLSTSIEPLFLAVDASQDISDDTVEFTLDRVTWVTASHIDPPAGQIAAAAVTDPVPGGMTRYWVRLMVGPGQELEPPRGRQAIIGRITDSPDVPERTWTFYAH